MKAFLLLFLLPLSAFTQNKKEHSIGYVDAYEKLPKISFEKVTATQYEKYVDQQYLTQPKIQQSKNQLLVPTKSGQLKFKKYNAEEQAAFKGVQYMGYFPKLKMHVLTSHHTAEHIGFSDLFLIDSLNAYRYAIVSIGDGAVETPIPSIHASHMVYYYNEVYDKNSCFIGLLKVNQRKQPRSLFTEQMSFSTKDWAVENIRWITDNSFIVKAYVVNIKDQVRTKAYSYYLAKIEAAK